MNPHYMNSHVPDYMDFMWQKAWLEQLICFISPHTQVKRLRSPSRLLFKRQGGREAGKGRQVRGVRGGRSLLTDGEGRWLWCFYDESLFSHLTSPWPNLKTQSVILWGPLNFVFWKTSSILLKKKNNRRYCDHMRKKDVARCKNMWWFWE